MPVFSKIRARQHKFGTQIYNDIASKKVGYKRNGTANSANILHKVNQPQTHKTN
jgi:hypothetical protein